MYENNRFPGNPPIMSDGRLFTDYRPHHDMERDIMVQYLPNSNPNYDEYRQFLNTNADEVKDNAYLKAWHASRCRNCYSKQMKNTGHEGTTIRNIFDDILNVIAKPKNLMQNKNNH